MFSLHSLFDKVVLFTAREKCSGEQNRQGLMLPSALNLKVSQIRACWLTTPRQQAQQYLYPVDIGADPEAG